MNHEEVPSSIVSIESTILASVIKAYEERDMGTGDILNVFIWTNYSIANHQGHKTIMQMRGKLVDILCQIDPNTRNIW